MLKRIVIVGAGLALALSLLPAGDVFAPSVSLGAPRRAAAEYERALIAAEAFLANASAGDARLRFEIADGRPRAGGGFLFPVRVQEQSPGGSATYRAALLIGDGYEVQGFHRIGG